MFGEKINSIEQKINEYKVKYFNNLSVGNFKNNLSKLSTDKK